MTPPSTSSRLRPRSPQPRRHHQPIRQQPPNPRPRKPPSPRQQRQPRLMPVIPTTMRRPIDRVTNTNPVSHTISTRTQPRRPPKHRPRRSTTKPNRTVRPDNSSTLIRRGTSIIPKRNRPRLRPGHARGRHNRMLLLLLLPRLRRRHPRYQRRMRVSLVRRRRRRVNAQWQIRLRQRRQAGSRISRPRVGRGRHPLDRTRRAMSLRPCLHI